MKIIFILSMVFFVQVSLAAPPKKADALLAKGKAAYKTSCVACHGEKGDGNGPAGAVMTPKPRHFVNEKFVKGDTVDALFNTITNGLEGTAMTGFSFLPEEDRWGVAYYVLSLRQTKGLKWK